MLRYLAPLAAAALIASPGIASAKTTQTKVEKVTKPAKMKKAHHVAKVKQTTTTKTQS